MQYEDEAGTRFEYSVSRDEEGDRRLHHDGYATIERCIAQVPEVVVPDTLGGYPIRIIAEEAFASSRMADREAIAIARESAPDLLQEFLSARKSGANGQLARVVLPQGLLRIGKAAFRGCANLQQVELPETLERIDDLAISCTDVRELRIPARCTQLSERALCTGPETVVGAVSTYRSRLQRIDVDQDNPRYVMWGPVLCQRVEGGLRTLMCPGTVDEVDLTGDVFSVAPGTFAGTYELGHLSIREGLACDSDRGLLPHGACDRLTIVLAGNAVESTDAKSNVVDIRLSASLPRKELFAAACASGRFDASQFLASYDRALCGVGDRFERAQFMLVRLANPYALEEELRERFAAELAGAFDPLCAHFGARGMWSYFDLLADAGVLIARNVSHAIDVLSKVSDSAAVGYLLQMKRSRFADKAWDYGI